ncbi:MAG TPA: hypothetical protein VK841_25975 [Polyangiaceae bacterium]|nr:hypothetical protein [Polyangiaceae bacterium]
MTETAGEAAARAMLTKEATERNMGKREMRNDIDGALKQASCPPCHPSIQPNSRAKI